MEYLALWNKWPLGKKIVFVEFLVIYFKGIRQLNVFLFYIVTELDIGKEMLSYCRQRL